MREPEYILLLDVETANSLDDPLVYDLGLVVTDRKGRIYEKYSFIIYDVYRLERDLMGSCYYAEKIPTYEVLLRKKESKMVTFATARRVIKEIIKRYKIKVVAAYNMSFDRRALNTTLRYIFKSRKGCRWFFPYGVKYWCIWNMACQTICVRPSYQKWARKKGLVSESGNITTNAETVYKFITKKENFTEEHKGLDDALIEAEILAYCFRQHKKMVKGINRGCWRIPNTKELKEKYAV